MEDSTRKKSIFYHRLLKDRLIKLDPADLRVARSLEYEKFCTIMEGYCRLNGFCDEYEYEVQRKINERCHKTIINLVRINDMGQRSIIQKLFLPFHVPKTEAKNKFLTEFPQYKEDDRHTLQVQHTDSIKREVWTV